MVKIDFLEKNPLDPFWGKKGKSGRGSWAERIQNERFPTYLDFQYILNLIRQIWMKLSGNVPGIKRMKTDEFGHMFARSCPGMPII